MKTARRADPDQLDWTDFQFADTHVHIWNLADPRLHYSYLEPGFVHPQLGDISPLKRDYSIDDLIEDFGRVNTRWAVHVQAAFGIEDPYDETAFVQEAIDEVGFPTVMVANVDLCADDVESQLERHLRHDRVRGIRDQKASDGYLLDRSYRQGAEKLAEAGLHLEIEHWGDLSPVASLAEAVPGLRVVLDHTGRPPDLSRSTFRWWREQMALVASAPNTWCKISGLGMADASWTLDTMSPFVRACIEEFGVERCFLGTNWPVDSLYSSYEVLIASYRVLLSDLSPRQQQQLFVENADRLYGLREFAL